MSNGEPLRAPGSPTPDAPLNPLIGRKPDQPWTLTIAPAAGLSGLVDVVFGIAYTADPA